MRILFNFEFPLEPFNTYVRDGTLADKLGSVVDHIGPECIYFSEWDGARGGLMVVDVPEASRIPSVAEPLFLVFKARVRMRVCMTMQDLEQAGLREIGASWDVGGWG